MSERGLDWEDRSVGEIVAEDYRKAAVFERHGIDFCCGGSRNVRDACDSAGVDYATVAQSLSAVGSPTGPASQQTEMADWELHRLADHIVEKHHTYVRESTPLLREFADKIAQVHGVRHPELLRIRDLVDALLGELEEHMEEEESVLFPRIAALSSPEHRRDGNEVRTATTPLEDDHDRAGTLMKEIHRLSDGFSPPEDACATYRATYAKLAEFEADLHRHVHLENNILFPRAAAAEAALGGAPRGAAHSDEPASGRA